MKFFNVPMTVLRRTKRFFKEIRKKYDIKGKVKQLLTANAVFFGIYGCIIGAFSGVPQALASMVKLPILFLLTLIVAFPTLYILNLLQGSKKTIGQYFALILGSTAVTSIILLGFAPITILFMITSDHYQFFKILNVLLFAVSGFAGMKFFYDGMLQIGNKFERSKLSAPPPTKEQNAPSENEFVEELEFEDTEYLEDAEYAAVELEDQVPSPAESTHLETSGNKLETDDRTPHNNANSKNEIELLRKNALARKRTLRAWVILYGLIGSQLAWVLRPFFGAPGEEFEIFREIDGNFFTNILEAIASILGFK